MLLSRRLLLLSILVASLPQLLMAGDWPQILGPNRDGRAVKEKLAERWAAGGPRQVWQHPVGAGYSGLVVSDGKLIVYHRLNNRDQVDCLDAATGKSLWKADFPTSFEAAIVADDGPRSTPLIHGGQLFVFSAEGTLRCLKMTDGSTVWTRPPGKRYSAPNSYFGAGPSPIVEGDLLLVNLGEDRNGAGIVALSLKDGTPRWQATNEIESYSSPVAATIGKDRHVIFITRMNIVSVNPADGAERFRFKFGQRGPTVNGATPLVFNNHLFVTASYGIGAAYYRLSPGEPELVWESDEIMSSQYPTPVEHEGKVYGMHGRDDAGPADLRCIDPATQKVLWSETGFGMATGILADGKLVLQKTDGTVVLVRAASDKFTKLAEFELMNSTVRALPALAGGRFYVRDESTLKCVQIGAE